MDSSSERHYSEVCDEMESLLLCSVCDNILQLESSY